MSCAILFEVLENNSIKVSIVAVDEAGATILRADLTNPQWQLMTSEGDIINNRSFANTAYDSTTELVFFLKSADTVTFVGENEISVIRTVDFKAQYDTEINGEPVLDVDLRSTFSFMVVRTKSGIQEVVLIVDDISQDQVIDNLVLVV